MSKTVIVVASLFLWRAAGQPIDTSPQAVLHRAVLRARAHFDGLSNYTCTEEIRRRYCRRPKSAGHERCAACEDDPSTFLARTDRVRVEVGISRRGDVYSWPGETGFSTSDLHSLVGGGTTTVGEFGSFAISVLLTDADPDEFRVTEGGFSFRVPLPNSHFAIRGGGLADYLTAYRGTFRIDEATGDLRELEVIVDEPPEETGLRKVVITGEYRDLRPIHSRTVVIGSDGDVASTDTTYSGCRIFGAESKILAADALEIKPTPTVPHADRKFPVGLDVDIALNDPIDSTDRSTGDRIEGRLLRELRDADGGFIAPAGTIVEGRIMRLERRYCPSHNFVLGLKFERLLLNGEHIPLPLEPPEFHEPAGGRSSPSGYIPPHEPEMALVPEENRPGVQSFLFRNRDRLRLGRSFVSKWKVGSGETIAR